MGLGRRLEARRWLVYGMAGKNLPEGGGQRRNGCSGGWGCGGSGHIGSGRALNNKQITRCLQRHNPGNTSSIPFPLERVPGQISLRNTGLNHVHESPQCAEGAVALCVAGHSRPGASHAGLGQVSTRGVAG